MLRCISVARALDVDVLTAAPEEFGFAALAGERLRSSSVARAFHDDGLMTSLPHLRNLLVQL